MIRKVFVENIKKKDPRIKYYRNQVDIGPLITLKKS